MIGALAQPQIRLADSGAILGNAIPSIRADYTQQS
jgi:hypothetical protein